MRSLVYERRSPDAGAFRLISRNCLDGLRQMRESHRFLRGMVAWVGYAQIAIPYERAARVASKSKYPLHKMLAFAWTAATSFSILPLRIIMTFGLVVMLFGVEEALRPILAHIFNCYTVRGWSELIVVISVLGGTIMSVGMLASTSAKITNSRKSVRYTW